jgi:hypothetical protein
MNTDHSTPDSPPPESLHRIFLAFVLLIIITFVGYSSGFFFRTGILGCNPPPGIAVDGETVAKVLTWNDLNGNGIMDASEPPLPWITIYVGYPLSLTMADGQGVASQFAPGCACRCWTDKTVSAQTPPGYRATTPTEVPLTGDDDTYQIGFQAEDNARLPSFPGEPDWYQAFLNHGLNLVAFHRPSSTWLMISLKDTVDEHETEADRYRKLFEVMNGLEAVDITVPVVEITSVPSGKKAICTLADEHCQIPQSSEP